MKNDIDIRTENLVNIYRQDKKLFDKLFSEAQRIYVSSFPKEEREHGHLLRKHIHRSAHGLSKRGNYNYLVALADGKVRAMTTFTTIKKSDFSLLLWGYVATDPKWRNKGIGRIIHKAILQDTIHNISPDFMFLEIEQPKPLRSDGTYEDSMRDSIRPKFHNDVSGAGCAVTIKEDDISIIPYAQPGILVNDEPQPIVPLLPAISSIGDGLIDHYLQTPGEVISPEGKLLVNKELLPTMDTDKASEIIHTMLNHYILSKNTYCTDHIVSIEKNIEQALEGSQKVYLIPILGTRYLDRIEDRIA